MTFFLNFIRRWAWLILSAIPLVYLVFIVARYGVDVPYMDQWELIPLLEKSYQGTLSFDDLWTTASGHRILFPRIVMISLARITGWNIHYELALNIVLATGIFLFIVRQIRTTFKSIHLEQGKWLVPMVSFILFSPNQVENWLYGWDLTYFLSMFSVVSGIILLANANGRWFPFVCAILLGVVASYSGAIGLIYWPVGIFVLILVGLDRRLETSVRIGVWLVCGLVTIFFYFAGSDVVHRGWSMAMLSKPVEYIEYAFTYIGVSLVTFSHRLNEVPVVGGLPFVSKATAVVGLLGMVIWLASSWQLFRRRIVDPKQLAPYLALCLFALGAAALSAIGRAGVGASQALSSRYATISNLFWISNVVLLYILASATGMRRTGNSKIVPLFAKGSPFIMAGILFMVLLSSTHRTVSAKNRFHYLTAGRNELFAISNDSTYNPTTFLFPNLGTVKRRLDILEKYSLSLFRDTSSKFIPRISNPKVDPSIVSSDGTGSTLITASVSTPRGDFAEHGTVKVDLTWQVFRYQKMFDDGTNGDAVAGDGVYSYLARIPGFVQDRPVKLLITATGESKSADTASVWLSIADPGAIYVDNSDAEFVCDDWVHKSGAYNASGAFRQDYAYHVAGDGSCKAIWRFDVPHTGRYAVYAWWTTGYPYRCSNAKYTVFHLIGSDTTVVNQLIKGSRWNHLGTYSFEKETPGSVVLSDDVDIHAQADAVKVVLKR